MSAVLRLLAFAGRHGPAILCLGVVLGCSLPDLASALHPAMDAAVFVFTLGAFLRVDAASIGRELHPGRARRNLLLLGWTGFGVPLTAWLVILFAQPRPELAQGLLICTLAPPVGSAAALAATLGLNASIALLASVTATVLAPLAMPLLAQLLGGYEVQLDPGAMAMRLLVLVGGALLTSWGLRRFAPRIVSDNPLGVTGIAILARAVFAIGAMDGMPARLDAQPDMVMLYLAIAFAVNAGLQLLGTVLFHRCGLETALTIGLVSGNRNIGLAWAALGPGLPPLLELYLAMSVFPIYLLPLALKPLLERWQPDVTIPGAKVATKPVRVT